MQRENTYLFLPAVLAALFLQIFVWFLWYPLVGYSTFTLTVAELSTALVGYFLITKMPLELRHIGLSRKALVSALSIVAVAYVLTVLVAAVLGENPLFRSYSLGSFFDGWVLVGFGEELLFAGVIYTAARAEFCTCRRWKLVLLVALVFAMWHLPGYIARDLPWGSIAGRLALNFASWSFFGAIYALSGNLWLAAFTHASTDFPLTPVITNSPIMGLLFIGSVVAISWWMKRDHRS